MVPSIRMFVLLCEFHKSEIIHLVHKLHNYTKGKLMARLSGENILNEA